MTVAVAHQVSRTSRLALTEGAREAKLRGSNLAVLHVADEALDPDRIEAYRLGVADEIEKVVAEADAAGVPWQLHLASADDAVDDVVTALLQLADQVEAKMLVLGARRRSPVGKAFLGSVTQNVILEASMPVLIVKSPK
jgi:nucleotide-binding universal stress UspA family protein